MSESQQWCPCLDASWTAAGHKTFDSCSCSGSKSKSKSKGKGKGGKGGTPGISLSKQKVILKHSKDGMQGHEVGTTSGTQRHQRHCQSELKLREREKHFEYFSSTSWAVPVPLAHHFAGVKPRKCFRKTMQYSHVLRSLLSDHAAVDMTGAAGVRKGKLKPDPGINSGFTQSRCHAEADMQL